MLSLGGTDQNSPQTYIVAPNPAILAILMRDADTRNTNPSAYTTPASVFNTLAVDFDSDKPSATNVDQSSAVPIPISSSAADVPLKTVIMPAAELQKLDRMAATQSTEAALNVKDDVSATDAYQTMTSGVSHISLDPYNTQTQTDTLVVVGDDGILCTSPAAPPQQPHFPVPCEIINAHTQQSHSIDPMYKVIKKSSMSRLVTETPDRTVNQPPPYHQHINQQSYTPQSPFSFCSPTGQVAGHFQMAGQYYPQSSYFPQQQPHNPHAAISPTPHCSLPPACQSNADAQQQMKSRSLERNTNAAQITFANRISSLERAQNVAKQQQQQQVRSNSLTRQMSTGQDYASRSGSFDRYQPHQALPPVAASVLVQRTNSLERQPIGGCVNASPSTAMGRGSLERNQSYDLMKSRGFRGGSLERNQQQALLQGVAMIASSASRAGSLDRNPQYHAFRNQLQRTALNMSTDTTEQPFQEEIYDFGGANVKSCASIALSKSISKGMLPAGTILPQSPSLSLHHPSYQQQSPPMYGHPSPSNHFQPTTNAYPLSPQQQHQHQQPQQQHNQSMFSPNATYTQMHPRIWPPATSSISNNNNNNIVSLSVRPNAVSIVAPQPSTQLRTGASGLPPVGHKSQPPSIFSGAGPINNVVANGPAAAAASNQVCVQHSHRLVNFIIGDPFFWLTN